MVVKEEEKGKGGDAKGDESKGKIREEEIQKAVNPKGWNQKEKLPKERTPGEKIHNGRIRKRKIPKEEGNCQKLKRAQKRQAACMHRTRRENRTGDQRSEEASTRINSGTARLTGNTSMEPGE